MSDTDKEVIGRLMAKHLDSIIDTYIELEPTFLEEVQKTNANVKIYDTSFFGAAASGWADIWAAKSQGALDTLRASMN